MLGALQFFPPLIPALGIDRPGGRTIYGILLIALVVGLFITQWQENSRKDDSAEENRRLLTLAVEGHNVTQTLMSSIEDARERKAAAVAGAGAISIQTPSPSGEASVTVTPGTSELVLEGFAPTITVGTIDQEIQEKEEALRSHLAEEESGWWGIASQTAAYQRNTQNAPTQVAVQMQNMINNASEELPPPKGDA